MRFDKAGRFGETRSLRFEPNVRLASQAMLGATALFGMGSQTGSTVAVYAAAAIALYALMVPGAMWQVAISAKTWRFAGGIALRLAMFAVAIMGAAVLADAGPILGALGSLAFIGVLGAAGFAVASRAWRLAPVVGGKAQRFAGRRSHALDYVWMLARLSIS